MLLMGREMLNASLHLSRSNVWSDVDPCVCCATRNTRQSRLLAIGKFQRRRVDEARHGEVEAERDEHLAARGCWVWCLVWNLDATENLPIAAMDPLQDHCRRCPSSWESLEVGVHQNAAPPWEESSRHKEYQKSHKLFVYHRGIPPKATKSWKLSRFRFPSNAQFPMLMISVHESTPAPPPSRGNGAPPSSGQTPRRGNDASSYRLSLQAIHLFFGTTTATSQLTTPSPRLRHLDRCVHRHHRDRDTLLATSTINYHWHHAKHTPPKDKNHKSLYNVFPPEHVRPPASPPPPKENRD